MVLLFAIRLAGGAAPRPTDARRCVTYATEEKRARGARRPRFLWDAQLRLTRLPLPARELPHSISLSAPGGGEGRGERPSHLSSGIGKLAAGNMCRGNCLSPQCGFSSTVGGNALVCDKQIAKLSLGTSGSGYIRACRSDLSLGVPCCLDSKLGHADLQ